MMTDPPRLTEEKIHRWIGGPSFERGQRYYLQGRILNPLLPELYRVYH
jgi:hypothetical protein